MNMQSGIYEIANTVNGKRYIGSAANFTARWAGHLSRLKHGSHHSPILQRAWNKYGGTAFEFRPVMLCERPELVSWEQKYLDEFKPEYNVCKIAGSTLGRKPWLGKKHSEETRAKMSRSGLLRYALRGVKQVEQKPARTPDGKYVRSAETRAKLSTAKKGKPGHAHTAEFRAKLSERNRGNCYAVGNANALGVKHPPAFGAAISARQKGKILSAEWCAAISAGNKGKVLSEETRRKISVARTGIKNPAVVESNKRRAGEKRKKVDE